MVEGEKAVDAELHRWLEGDVEPSAAWKEWQLDAELSGDGDEEDVQAEVDRLLVALQFAERNACHSRLNRAAAAGRLEALKEQRAVGDGSSLPPPTAQAGVADDELQSVPQSTLHLILRTERRRCLPPPASRQ